MKTKTWNAERAPYPAWTYPGRGAWFLVQATFWRVAWGRIYILRPAILRLFGASVSLRCLIRGSVRVHFPWLVTIGSDVAISHGVVLYNLGGITVGNRAVISQDVYLCGGTHDYRKNNYPLVRKPIIIEDDVWI